MTGGGGGGGRCLTLTRLMYFGSSYGGGGGVISILLFSINFVICNVILIGLCTFLYFVGHVISNIVIKRSGEIKKVMEYERESPSRCEVAK